MDDRREKERPLEQLAQGFRKRTWVTAKLATKLGVKYMKKTAGVTSPVDTERAVQAAEKLVREVGALKGLVMKFGQLASYMPGALPPEAQQVLARLQAQSTALGFERVRQALTEELGAPPEQRFDELEPEPFAAASIGQVHRGRIGQQRVAVKVQYPGIEALLRGDLKLVGHLVSVSTMGSAVDGKGAAEELRARILEECDYRVEADNQRFFKDLFEHHDDSHVPEVIASHSTGRVLTSELVEGAASFYPFSETASRAVKDRAAAVIFRTCFDCLFGHAIYNADPHPGNYLFHPDGAVTFLDFGCVRRFDPAMIDVWKQVARSVLDGDRERFKDRYVALGMVGKPKKFDWDHQWQVMQYLYRPFLAPPSAPFTYTHAYVRESYDVLLFKNPNQRATAMPPEWLFLNRLQWGMNSVLAHLGATGPWGELWRAAIDSKTEPLGPNHATRRTEAGSAPLPLGAVAPLGVQG